MYKRQYAGFTITASAKIERRIGLSEAEVLVYSIEITFLAGKGNDIGRVHAVVLVVHIELVDTALVGMCGDAIIGHADSHPHLSLIHI